MGSLDFAHANAEVLGSPQVRSLLSGRLVLGVRGLALCRHSLCGHAEHQHDQRAHCYLFRLLTFPPCASSLNLPAHTREGALLVGAVSEEYDWLRDNPCLCGGRWKLALQRLIEQRRSEAGLLMTDQLHVFCTDCSRQRDFFFVVNYGAGT